jgi:leader peptidase (prepilin peptidase)/N-methyltransferase
MIADWAETLRSASGLWPWTALAFGLVVGSFANVCVHRVPLRQSVVTPPSRCPHCGARIAPWDNVPVASYLLLRGRCRSCQARISPRYPAVEAANGALYLAVAAAFGPSLRALVMMAFVTALLVLALIDLEHHLLPDAITLPGIALGLAAGVDAPWAPRGSLALLGGFQALLLVGMLAGWDPRGGAPEEADDVARVGRRIDWRLAGMLLAFAAWQRAALGAWSEPALAALAGYLVMALVAVAAAGYYGQEALGQGDWKLAAMLGACLGLRGLLVAVFLGSLAGALVGGALWATGRASGRSALPLGTFLCAGGVAAALAGTRLLEWYGGLFRG